MANYHYNSAQLYHLTAVIGNQCSQWNEQLEKVAAQAEKLANSGNLIGRRASNLKNYIRTVHCSVLKQSLQGILVLLQATMQDYYGRFLAFDSSMTADIYTDALEHIIQSISSVRSSLESIESNMTSVVNSVNDISSQRYSGMTAELTALDKLKNIATETIDYVERAENSATSPLADLSQLITAASQIIFNNNITDLCSFSVNTFLASKSYKNLYNAANQVSKQLSRMSKTAEQNGKLIQRVNQQWQERREKAERYKLALGILEATALIAVAAGTGGLGLCVITGIAAGAVSGGASSTIDKWADGQFAADGGLTWETGLDIAYDADIGALKGAAKGFTSGVTAGATPGLNGWEKLAVECGKEYLDRVGVDSAFELIDAYYEGDKATHDKLQEMGTNAYWDKKGYEAITVATTNWAISNISNLVNDKVVTSGVDKLTDAGHPGIGKATEVIGKTAVSSGNKVASKKMEDMWTVTIDTAIDTHGDWNAVHNKATEEWRDHSKWIGRAIAGGMEAGIPAVYSQTSLYQRHVEGLADSRMNQQIDQKVMEEIQHKGSASGASYARYSYRRGVFLDESGAEYWDPYIPELNGNTPDIRTDYLGLASQKDSFPTQTLGLSSDLWIAKQQEFASAKELEYINTKTPGDVNGGVISAVKASTKIIATYETASNYQPLQADQLLWKMQEPIEQ